MKEGLRLFDNLISHFTTQTDDSHAVPFFPHKQNTLKVVIRGNTKLVRLPVDCRIKPHTSPFIQTPANLFKFYLCNLTPPARYLRIYLRSVISLT